MDEKECNSCRFYDPMDGYCVQREIYCHGYDGDDCEEWQKERDTEI